MNWKHITSIIIAVLFLAGSAIAQPPAQAGQGKGFMRGPGPNAPMGPHMALCKGLNLTDEQQIQIQNLKLKHQRAMVELQTDVASLRGKLKLLITDDSFKEKEVNGIVDKLAKAHQKQMQMKVKHLREVRDILTDEQKVRFDQKILSGRLGFGHGPGHGMGPGMERGPMGHRGR